jgi:hypothetical protein
MLWHTLMGANAAGGLQYVGGRYQNVFSDTPTCSLTGLSGGIDSTPSVGDIVIATITVRSFSSTITCTTAGYTALANLYSSATNRNGLGCFYKVLSTAETTVSFSTGLSTNGVSFACHVWRNVNPTTPIDVTTTTLTSTGIVNSPPITTVTNKCVILAVGSSSGLGGSYPLSLPTLPSGMDNLVRGESSDAHAIAIASFLLNDAGSFDPPEFGGFSTLSENGSCSATIALRSS